MADYWTGAAEGDASAAGGSAPVNADAPMDDEIMVGFFSLALSKHCANLSSVSVSQTNLEGWRIT